MEKFIRQIIRESIDNILNEGRLDKVTGEIVDLVWGAIKDSKQYRANNASYKFNVKEPLDVAIFVFIKRKKTENGVAHANADGEKIVGTNKIVIQVEISSESRKKESQIYSLLNTKINDVVRHEIEHETQERKKNYIQGRVKSVSAKEREKADTNYNYFLLRDEIPAMVAGMYREAKVSKKPVDQVYSDYLDFFVRTEFMTEENKKEIMKVWVEYTKKHYPAAQFTQEYSD